MKVKCYVFGCFLKNHELLKFFHSLEYILFAHPGLSSDQIKEKTNVFISYLFSSLNKEQHCQSLPKYLSFFKLLLNAIPNP